MGIKENLARIKEQIGNNSVKIIAVTKYANSEEINEAISLGISDFGESYVQDALEKISRKYQNEKSVNWHFIGRLQKNKVKYALGKFTLIHSVDSIELAESINKIANARLIVQDVLLQINIAGEITKTGFSKEEIKSSFEKLLGLPNVKILGLMTIAPRTNDENQIRKCFRELFELKEELNKKFVGKVDLKELSMGMSNDYKIAIHCGSTMIRVGRALFKETED